VLNPAPGAYALATVARTSVLSFLLRPSVVASVVAHAAAGLGLAAFADGSDGPAPAARSVSVWFAASEAESAPASAPAPDVLPPPPDAPSPVEEPVVEDGAALDALADAVESGDVVPVLEPPIDPGPTVEAPRVDVRVAPRRAAASARVRVTPLAPSATPSPAAPPRPAASSPSAASPGERGRVVAWPHRLATNRAPAYPQEARARGWEGVATFLVTVRLDGSVASAVLERSSGFAVLDEAAAAALAGWSFTPPVVVGDLRLVTVRVPVTFRLT
jgi:periplasmic protein TonB